jgi:rhodanese-related sulfurtransferase
MTETITGQSTMKEVLQAFPGAQRALFAKYHIGGCRSCAFSPEETLAELCARNEGIPVEEVLAHLEANHDADRRIFIEPTEVRDLLGGEASGIRLLDVRTAEEHEAVAIPGSRRFTQELGQEIFGTWAKDSLIVVYDHTGERVLDAAAYFIGHGFGNTRALRGGIDAYSREADPALPRYRVEWE